MSYKQPYIMISAGGTGGHMSPASALASELKSRGCLVELLTDGRGMRYESMFKGIEIHEVKSGTAGAGIGGKIRGAINLVLGIIHAYKMIRAKKPDVVVGFGGYPSVPGVFAAQRLNIPTVLHEQNAIIGKANVFLAAKANVIALSLPYVTGLDNDVQKKMIVTGNPVRPEIMALNEQEYEPVAGGKMSILIMGGSLGATVLSDVVPRTLSMLSKEYKDRLNIVQQCRQSDIDDVFKAYEEAGIKADLKVFIDDVATIIGKSHLVIARSGASTVAEVCVAGVPAIYVPYPHHKDQQQKRNADAIADEGGAWVMMEESFTPETLLPRIETFFQNADILPKVAMHARKCGRVDAAKSLSDTILSLITKQTKD